MEKSIKYNITGMKHKIHTDYCICKYNNYNKGESRYMGSNQMKTPGQVCENAQI